MESDFSDERWLATHDPHASAWIRWPWICFASFPARTVLTEPTRRCPPAPERRSVHCAIRSPHQRPPEFQLLLLLHRRQEFSAVLQLPGLGSEYSWVRRERRFPLPAVQSEPHLDDQQLAGERISLHLHAGRPVDVPASANTRMRCRIRVRLPPRRRLFQRNVGFHCNHRARWVRIPQYGITTGLPANHTGVPFISISGGFAIGNGWEGELPQVGNSFMWSDNLTWVKGNHTMKFGADVRRARASTRLFITT